jgi:hypothetical protein
MLTEAQRRALLLQMHRSIEEVAARVASELRSGVASLSYPPNCGLTRDETRAIAELRSIAGLESALRKIVASAASFPLYHFICILDGIGDPADYDGEWLGARIDPVPLDSDGSEENEPLRYEFFDSYWDWRKMRPEPGWRLDDLDD